MNETAEHDLLSEVADQLESMMSEPSFEVGDTVKVKGQDGPTMTITRITPLSDGLTANVTWWDHSERQWQEHSFPIKILEPATDDNIVEL